ncbi:hypothetical protein [Trichococcus ilyis]|uniref:hypothetical protein n=1 Tax=Trichococcus ilyis TaxID=640938 RepID=UPI0012EE37A4|nr:hypothetical protein [Trichococcus ilyis]
MRNGNKLFVRQFEVNDAFGLNALHLHDFVCMKEISVEGFLIKQAQKIVILTFQAC